ncbi:YqaJ-like recombinase domain-containing protein [Oryzisolibacter propanilivorax]|uniref:YqaJ-like recombinase domain-containing protein n=1 Tax=Oryzisolibacter propanilivorax TaxID=1527607 RepID=A0A1G9SMC3_9BURK|nr:lambda exonuclease family protein [Oryzisolibacter propanilivorax]SDM36616.1 YqaJ-like recombinase domain-containing protein [Oryzisolibacter propanilivorax]
MRISDAPQGSPEWFQARLGKATGSRFADVLAGGRGLTRRAYATQLALELITGQPAETYTSAAMQLGTEREPTARALYEALTGNFVTEVGFCLHDSLPCGISPDGLIDDDGGLEIKCPHKRTHADYLALPAEPACYTAQIQGCLWVTQRRWWDFVSFNPAFPVNARLIVRRIWRDEAYIGQLEQSVAAFAGEVQAMVELIRNYRNPELAPQG